VINNAFGLSTACLVFNVVAIVCSQLQSYPLVRRVTPILAQIALTGLVPVPSLRFPHFPLFTGNAILLASLSLVNVLFLARNIWQSLVCAGVLVLYAVLAYVQRQ